MTVEIRATQPDEYRAAADACCIALMAAPPSDEQWERIAPLIIGRPDQKGSTGRDNRMFVEGVLWISRTGSPWRDQPEALVPDR